MNLVALFFACDSVHTFWHRFRYYTLVCAMPGRWRTFLPAARIIIQSQQHDAEKTGARVRNVRSTEEPAGGL